MRWLGGCPQSGSYWVKWVMGRAAFQAGCIEVPVRSFTGPTRRTASTLGTGTACPNVCAARGRPQSGRAPRTHRTAQTAAQAALKLSRTARGSRAPAPYKPGGSSRRAATVGMPHQTAAARKWCRQGKNKTTGLTGSPGVGAGGGARTGPGPLRSGTGPIQLRRRTKTDNRHGP